MTDANELRALVEHHAKHFHVRSLDARCDHERAACNDASATIRRVGTALIASREAAVKPLGDDACEKCDDSGYQEFSSGGLDGGLCVKRQGICDCVCGDDVRREKSGRALGDDAGLVATNEWLRSLVRKSIEQRRTLTRELDNRGVALTVAAAALRDAGLFEAADEARAALSATTDLGRDTK